MDTIKRWIDESDIYMLILGGRYGSLDKETEKSYTQLEYEYAISQEKPFFAVVLSDKFIDEKVKADGKHVLESEHPARLKTFKEKVLSKVCKFVDNTSGIQLAVMATIIQFEREYLLTGWVWGKDVADAEELRKENMDLNLEIAKLTKANAELQIAQITSQENTKKDEFKKILRSLGNKKLTYNDKKEKIELSVVHWFYNHINDFVNGMYNKYDMSEFYQFLFFQVGPSLALYDLVATEKISGAQYRRMATTKKGNEFILFLENLAQEEKAIQQANLSEEKSPKQANPPEKKDPPSEQKKSAHRPSKGKK